jgi:hypothetical protein
MNKVTEAMADTLRNIDYLIDDVASEAYVRGAEGHSGDSLQSAKTLHNAIEAALSAKEEAEPVAGDHTGRLHGPYTTDAYGSYIYGPSEKGGVTPVLDIRAWGYLTGNGQGSLALPAEEAVSEQQSFAKWVTSRLNASPPPPDPHIAALVERCAIAACDPNKTYGSPYGMDYLTAYMTGRINAAEAVRALSPFPRTGERQMTPEQIKLARHALGLDNPDAKGRSYRNRYFVSGFGHSEWDKMVRAGNAEFIRNTYHLTRSGALAVLQDGERLDPEDFPALTGGKP